MTKHIPWDALRGSGLEPQTIEWSGGSLKLTSGSDTISIPAANLTNLLTFLLDTAVQNEFRQLRADKYARARTALGASAGVTFTGFTAAVTTNRGVVLTQTSGAETFDVTESHKFAVQIANLCQDAIPDAAGLLQRS